MFANNLENLTQYLTITNNDWDLELWEKAAHPDLEVGFFVASGIWMTINVIVGTFANGVVLLAFFRDLKLRTPFNYILINLIVSDFFMMSLGLPLDIVASFQLGWKMGYTPCIMLGFIMTLTGMGSVYTLTALSLQRCFILYYPTEFSIHGASLTKYVVALIWIIAFIFAFPPLFGLGSIYRPELSGLSCGPCFEHENCLTYAVFILGMGFIFPLSCISTASYLIVIKLRQHTKLQIGIKMNKDLVEEREKKVTKMVFLMVFAFIGAWSGYALLCILRLFGIHSSDIAFGLVMFAAKSGGWLNTLVFIFMNTQFRAAILPSWILDYFEKIESQEDAGHVDESPPNMSNSSKTPKTPNNSVEVPNPAAAVVTVENCPKSCANKVAPTEV